MTWQFRPSSASDTDKISRRERRRAAKSDRSNAQTMVLFETFEQRVLLSATPLAPPIGTILASDHVPATVQDIDGTQISVAVSGAGHWQLTQGALAPVLTITGTDNNSAVALTTSGGDGRIQLGGIDLEGPAKSLIGASVDLTGGFITKGGVQTITLGTFKDVAESASAAIGTLAIQSWQSGGSGTNGLQGTTIGTLKSQGDLNLSLNLNGQAATGLVLGSVSTQGALAGGLWHVAGRAGAISAASVSQGWTGDFTGPVSQITTTGDFDGTLATPSLQFLIVGGNLAHARLYIGADLGANGQLGGTGANADTFGTGVLGHLRVSGAVTDSRVYVGVDPKNGIFDDGNDLILGGTSSQVQEILIGGGMDAASRIEARSLPATARLNGATITPASSPKLFGVTSIDTVAPSISARLANDTGSSATDGLTQNPTIVGAVADAGGVASFRGGLDATVSTNFTDLLALVKADGSFTLTRAQLAQLAGGTLADGIHTLHLVATDKTGNRTNFDFTFSFDATAPALTGSLVNDTGSSAADSLTKDDTIGGRLTDSNGVANLTGAMDAGAVASLATLLNPDGSFTLTSAFLAQLAGGTLADGTHALHLVGTDKAGNSTSLDLSFVLDTAGPSLTAGLAKDTGSNTSDGLTRDDTVAGQLTDPNGIAALTGTLDTGAASSLAASLQPNGSFTLTPAMIVQLAGGATADGLHTLHLAATDKAGNTSAFDLSFTLRTTPPAQPVFDLAPDSHTGAPGDHTTSDTPVTLIGTTAPNATVTLVEANLTTTADGTGAFQFTNVALVLGANSFTALATDAAGNTSTYQLTITRVPSSVPDTTAPTLTAALAHDTGISATDGITSDPTIAGTLADNVGGTGVATFKGGLDATTAANFTDLIANLNSNGTFVLSSALMNTLAGGTLADGAHTLHLTATDNSGNTTNLDVSFTLQTSTPAITAFGLAQSSDTGTIGDNITANGVVTLTGVATAGSTISFGTTKALAGDGGVFQITNVALAPGLNTFTVTATSPSGVTSQATLQVTRQGTTTTDAALTWNQTTLATISGLAMYPPDASRLLAIVSLAQYDTLAAI